MLVDHINKDGFFYRNAYPFNYKPTRVRICAIVWWRFPVFGILRILCSLFLWLVFGVFLGLQLWIITGPYQFLMGKKLVHDSNLDGFEPATWVIGIEYLRRLCLLSYRVVPIERLPVINGKRIQPWRILLPIVIMLALWYMGPAVVSATISGAQSVWDGVTWLSVEFMSTLFWISILLFAFLIITGLITWRIHEFRKTEIYGLLLMGFRAGVDKICPIIPVK